MGQNNFILFGFLTLAPEKERVVSFEGIPYVKAILESGPAYAGEVHPVLITGESANIAFAEFQKHPDGFMALARGGFKTYNKITQPVIHYLEPYEPGAWLLKRAGLI
jgi:hypothetical protein